MHLPELCWLEPNPPKVDCWLLLEPKPPKPPDPNDMLGLPEEIARRCAQA